VFLSLRLIRHILQCKVYKRIQLQRAQTFTATAADINFVFFHLTITGNQIDVMALRKRIDNFILDLWNVNPSSVPVNIYNTLRKKMRTLVSFSFDLTGAGENDLMILFENIMNNKKLVIKNQVGQGAPQTRVHPYLPS